MTQFSFIPLFILFLLSHSQQLLGETNKDSVQETLIDLEFDSEQSPINSNQAEDTSYSKRFDEIFKNPVVMNGLDTGTEAINRSLESIMDSVFYSLLDNDRRFTLLDQSWFQFGLRRNLINANNGRYIVVDRFYLGPGFQKNILETFGVPWVLGAEATGEILQVYLQSDGKRVLEQQNLSTFRGRSNSWFGILNFLTSVLPPSFNQNELYDPITEIITPITFPLTLNRFKEMPIGSIRSYSLTGGIRLSPDLAGLISDEKLDHLKKIADLSARVPISLFKRGEHRINVFRKGENKAWVGVNEVDRHGILFEGSVGTIYAVFKNAFSLDFGRFSWVWNGFPIAFTPLNFNYQKSIAKLFDQVYEFDFAFPTAIESYEKAVIGDFQEALNAAKKTQEGWDTGVVFQFSRTQNRKEKESKRGPNIAVYKDIRESSLLKNEIEIRDFLGKYFILETMGEVVDKNWNILVGEMEEKVQSVVEMFVKPLPETDKSGQKYVYENPLNPLRLIVNYSIEDRYTNTEEFSEYIERVRFVSGLDLKFVEQIPILNQKKLNERSHRLYTAAPDRSIEVLHVSPTALGRLSAQVTLSFPYEAIKVAMQISRDQLDEQVRAIFSRHGVHKQENRLPSLRSSLLAYLAKPMDMINIRFPGLDEREFADEVYLSLEKIKKDLIPEKQLSGFLRLLDTNYPMQLTKLLLKISPLELVSRKVVFTTKPLSGLEEVEKRVFAKINGYEENKGLPFPPTSRYGRIKEKISQFYLDKPHSQSSAVEIASVQVFTKKVAHSWLKDEAVGLGGMVSQPQVFLSVQLKHQVNNESFKLYLRMEEGGRLQLGKFDLGEIVLDSQELITSYAGVGKLSYGAFVTGPKSVLGDGSVIDLGQKTTDFRLVLTVSKDGESWGSERVVEFYFEDGVLKPSRYK